MNYRRYGFGIYQEASKKDIDIDDEEDLDDMKDTDSDIDMDDEDEKPSKKKKSSKKKKDDDDDMDIDLNDDKDIDEDEKPKKKSKKNKNADIDDDEDIDFEDECGDGCSSKFKCESAKDKKDDNDDADIDLDAMGSDDVDDEPEEDEEEDKPKKKEKPEKDVDFGDDDEDDDKDIDEDEDDEKPSKSKKKSSKSKKKDDDDEEDDMDVDIDIEEECGDGGCTPKQFKEYVAEKRRRNRNLDVSDYTMEGADTANFEQSGSTDDTSDMGDVDESGSNEGSDVGPETECGDPVKYGMESAKSKKKKNDDLDVDLDDEDEDSNDEDNCDDEDCECDEDDEECKSSKKKDSKSKKKDDDDEEDEDVDFEEEAMHPTKASSEFVKASVKEHSDLQSEYAVDLIEQEELRTERQIMTSLIDELYKEYAIESQCDYYFNEYDSEEEVDEDDEIVQERYIGGLGKQVADLTKPIVKMGKHLNEKKHGVAKKGLIRNTVHLTHKDLQKGGILYKLFTWPFLIIKNLGKTIYHKTKAFTAYTSTLRAIEIKINREITHLKKNVHDMPAAASAAGIGYAATQLGSVAKGEGLQINPAEFVAHEGSKLIESLGKDTMLRGLTYKLANAFEEAPEKIGIVLKEKNKSGDKVTPDMANDSRDVLTIANGVANMQGVINMKGIDQFLTDIDTWCEISESVMDDVSDGNKSGIKKKMSELKNIQGRYSHHSGKLKADAIFNKRGGTVKIADFYEELSVKLSDKVKQLENGLKNVSEMEASIKNGTVQVNDDLKKTITEINTLIQHTCNYFTEIIDMIDDLGKYTMNTMNQYLGCLQQANKQMKHGKAAEPTDAPKRRKHILFHRDKSMDKEDEE